RFADSARSLGGNSGRVSSAWACGDTIAGFVLIGYILRHGRSPALQLFGAARLPLSRARAGFDRRGYAAGLGAPRLRPERRDDAGAHGEDVRAAARDRFAARSEPVLFEWRHERGGLLLGDEP